MDQDLALETPNTLARFLESTAQRDDRRELFTLENRQFLELNLSGQTVFAKAGSMVAFTGDVSFKREGAFDRGLASFFKRFLTSEGAALMKVSGRGRAYLADKARKIQLLRLGGESVTVNGNDLLAFESSLSFDVRMMRKLGAMAAGGLFNVQLGGNGHVAVCTHGTPLALRVTSQAPVFTDPQATVAWSSNLTPDLSAKLELSSLWGRSSGETFRMAFRGEGWVLIQPYEEGPVGAR